MIPKSLEFDTALRDIQEDEQQLFNGTSFLYDFKERDFVYENGNPVLVTGKEALKVWIEKAIRTRISTYEIYDNTDNYGFLKGREYGTNIWQLVRGQKLPDLVVQAETKRDIEEILLKNHKIKRIEDYEVSQGVYGKSYKLLIEFTVITVDEEDFTMEVSF